MPQGELCYPSSLPGSRFSGCPDPSPLNGLYFLLWCHLSRQLDKDFFPTSHAQTSPPQDTIKTHLSSPEVRRKA